MNKAVILPSSIDRANYLRVKQIVGSSFTMNDTALRLEAVLSPSISSYQLEFSENKGSDRPSEQKLNHNDAFFITSIAVLLTRQDESTTPKRYGNYPLFTYPDPNYHNGDDTVNMKEYEALECLYNGTLTLNTSPVDRLVNFPINLYKVNPERGFLVGAGTQPNSEFPQFGPSMEERGFFNHVPTIVLDGKSNNNIKLQLGHGDKAMIDGNVNSLNVAVNTRNVAVVLVRGINVINGATAANRWSNDNL